MLKKLSGKNWFYIIFFSVLVIGFYFIITSLVPEFTKRTIPPISYVRSFAFVNQDGKIVTNKDVAGKVYVAEYFFTTCTAICPRMNKNMMQVYDRFKDENDFLILSHTSDPEQDSAAQLKKYADSMGVNTKRWIFLTGRKDSLYNMARISYTIDDPANNLKSIDDQFLHTQLWALVNKNGDVVGVYDGMKQAQIKDLILDIEKQLKQKD
jgi:protein SCO1/2